MMIMFVCFLLYDSRKKKIVATALPGTPAAREYRTATLAGFLVYCVLQFQGNDSNVTSRIAPRVCIIYRFNTALCSVNYTSVCLSGSLTSVLLVDQYSNRITGNFFDFDQTESKC